MRGRGVPSKAAAIALLECWLGAPAA
jgi:hypothetical protein